MLKDPYTQHRQLQAVLYCRRQRLQVRAVRQHIQAFVQYHLCGQACSYVAAIASMYECTFSTHGGTAPATLRPIDPDRW